MSKRLVNTQELAKCIGITEGTARTWVCLKKIPYTKEIGLTISIHRSKINIVSPDYARSWQLIFMLTAKCKGSGLTLSQLACSNYFNNNWKHLK